MNQRRVLKKDFWCAVLDGLVTMGTVVEGSGGSSIQNLIYRTISDGSAANKFGVATINYAPTDSIQGMHTYF